MMAWQPWSTVSVWTISASACSSFMLVGILQSLSQSGRASRQQADAVEAFARRDVERLLAGSGKSHVGALSRRLDHAKIGALGVEHLNAGHRGDVDAVLGVDREAIGAAFRPGRNPGQLRGRPPGR